MLLYCPWAEDASKEALYVVATTRLTLISFSNSYNPFLFIVSVFTRQISGLFYNKNLVGHFSKLKLTGYECAPQFDWETKPFTIITIDMTVSFVTNDSPLCWLQIRLWFLISAHTQKLIYELETPFIFARNHFKTSLYLRSNFDRKWKKKSKVFLSCK